MSLLTDFNEIKETISTGISVKDYTGDWIEALIPTEKRGYIILKLKKIAKELEQKYSRPIHIHMNHNKFIIKLK